MNTYALIKADSNIHSCKWNWIGLFLIDFANLDRFPFLRLDQVNSRFYFVGGVKEFVIQLRLNLGMPDEHHYLLSYKIYVHGC